MKHFLFISLILLATFSRAQTTPATPDSYKEYEETQTQKMARYIGTAYPAFNGSINGVEFSNETFRGKTVFINFWFEACPPCIAEFEGLKAMYEKLKDRKDVFFIGVTFETPEIIKAIKEKYKITYNITCLPRTECYRLNFNNGFPTSIILDAKGNIKYIHTGGSTNADVATQFIMTEVYPKMLAGL